MNLQNIRIGVSSNLHAVIEGTRDSPTFNITCAGFEQNMFSPFIFGEHIVTGVEYLRHVEGIRHDSFGRRRA